MKTLIIATILAMLASGSRAGTLACSFTEPFFEIKFDSRTGTVTLISPDIFDEAGKLIPQVLAEGARLRVVNPDGDGLTMRLETTDTYILQLRMTGRGNDGMSES